MNQSKRKFLKNGLMSALGLSLLNPGRGWARLEPNTFQEAFTLKFSPEFGIFSALAGDDPIDQINWGKDNGFRAWENTMLKNRPVAEQEKISNSLQKNGMDFGQFVGTLTFSEVTFAGNNEGARSKVLKEINESVEIAKRMNTKFVHNVLGVMDSKLPYEFQIANAIELLKRAAEIYEKHEIVMVMETMNHKIDHPGMFLHTIPQAYALAKAVDSPSVKILFDIYHVQIQEGNLLPTLDHAWDEIAYFQIGDTPGRKEPGTGEINYKNVLHHIAKKGYRGFLGMEHGIEGSGKEGARSALQRYREIDKYVRERV
ncbi:hydroxypyruvate isomerase family protein [Pleomorphovibrio marinus]|uniref:hydroxypyruvate isomerase family protein n=1 Tax=Pleomorphovibrio marinus TaxID=2164132 RepID=UPI000E0AB93A|nr:TIM barrel protein [Pleomorphovibrio marinus]